MHLFGCLSVLLLFVVILIFSVIRGIFRFLFGTGIRRTTTSNQGSYSDTSSNRGEDTGYSSSTTTKKKVIDKDEGEYVDYEEVTD